MIDKKNNEINYLLSSIVKDEIDLWVSKFPADKKRSALLQALMIAQKENNGSLNVDLMDAVSNYLEVPKMFAYEVASFYSMYELKPVGKNKICICTNISCMINGSDKIVKYLNEKLNIKFGEITIDGKFSLKEVECLGACGGAPMMQVNNKYYENLTIKKIDNILKELG